MRPDGIASITVPESTDLEREHLVILEEAGHALWDEPQGITNGPLRLHRQHDAKGEKAAEAFLLLWLLPDQAAGGMDDEEIVRQSAATPELVRRWRELCLTGR